MRRLRLVWRFRWSYWYGFLYRANRFFGRYDAATRYVKLEHEEVTRVALASLPRRRA